MPCEVIKRVTGQVMECPYRGKLRQRCGEEYPGGGNGGKSYCRYIESLVAPNVPDSTGMIAFDCRVEQIPDPIEKEERDCIFPCPHPSDKIITQWANIYGIDNLYFNEEGYLIGIKIVSPPTGIRIMLPDQLGTIEIVRGDIIQEP